MKYLLLFFLLFSFFDGFSQRRDRFEDSLNLRTHRTWYRKDGSRFTKVNDNCPYGIEMTFYKSQSKVVERICEAGAWKEYNYTYEVIPENDDHYVIIYDGQKRIAKLEIQMLSKNQVDFKTEITYFAYSSKDIYTLVSNESK